MEDMPTKNDTEDLYQIALLIDQLKHDDSALRTNASKEITRIARALGPERTRDELVPFLADCVDDEDEVITVIAKELGELCDYVGGEEYVFRLLAPLELLICGEECLVREMGMKSLHTAVSKMRKADIDEHFFPLLNKLANRDWFTARSSAAAIVHFGYESLPNRSQEAVINIFLRLCKDETPLVRKVAAQSLAKMVRLVKSTDTMNDLVSVFKAFSKDEQDSIRIQVINTCNSIIEVVSPEVVKREVLPIAVDISKDKSWRVRWSLAQKLHSFIEVLHKTREGVELLSSLSGVFDSLLNDSEAEVRAAAASHLAVIGRALDKNVVVNKIIPTSQRLSVDDSDFVRAFFALEINHLAPVLGRDDAVQHILPVLLALLRDESSEVRLNVISHLDAINDVIGIDLLSQSLLPAITELAQDGKWRVRLAVIENSPMIARQLGVQFFDEKLINICMTWLGDSVYSIRRAAAQNLKQLSDIFGEEWCKRQIVPKIKELHDAAGYSKRLTALFAIQVLLQSVSASTIQSSLLPLLAAMAKDSVANVRFNVAKILQTAAEAMKNMKPTGEIPQLLRQLSTDVDRDVRFYAEQALRSLRTPDGA